MIHKVIPSDSQEELVKTVGQMVQVWDNRRMIKSAASPLYSRADLEAYAPPPGQFLSHMVTMGSGEMYGCLSGDCPVLMADGGFKPLASVEVGDEVVSGEGNKRRVSHLFEYDAEEVVRVKVGGLPTPLLASVNHPFMVSPKGGWACVRDKHQFCCPSAFGRKEICLRGCGCERTISPFVAPTSAYKRADQLELGDRLVYRFSAAPVEEEIGADEAFLMGLWLAEGSLVKNCTNGETSSLQFSLHKDEESTVCEAMRTAAASLGIRVNVHGPYDGDPNTIQVNLSGMPERARLWGSWFGSGGAREKRIPVWFQNLPREVIVSLLRGYFLGDGSKNDPLQVQATTVSRSLAFGIQTLLWRIGVAATSCYYEKDGILPDGKPHLFKGFRVNYALSRVPDYAAVLLFGHAPPALKQQPKAHVVVTEEAAYLPVRELTRLEWNSKVYTLEVEGDHSYVSAGVWSKNSNRNFDYWPHEELLRKHATFETHARNYLEHRNTDPSLAVGTVKSARYCPSLQRGEILMWTDIKKAAAEYEKARKGEEQSGSMAATVTHDVCDACGFVSKRPDSRCDCIARTPGKWMEGKKKYAVMINYNPTFKDYSWVRRPADRIAHYLNYLLPSGDQLQKAASAHRIPRGDELARAWGLGLDGIDHHLRKIASFDRPHQEDPAMQAFVNYIKPCAFEGQLPAPLVEKLASGEPAKSMRALVKNRVVVPFRSFAAWVSGTSIEKAAASEDVQEVESKMASVRMLVIQRLDEDPGFRSAFDQLADEFTPSCSCDDAVDAMLQKATDQFSARYEILSKRAKWNEPKELDVPIVQKISDGAFSLGTLYQAYLVKTAELIGAEETDYAILSSLR